MKPYNISSFLLQFNLHCKYELTSQCHVLGKVLLTVYRKMDITRGPPLTCGQLSAGATSEYGTEWNKENGQEYPVRTYHEIIPC